MTFDTDPIIQKLIDWAEARPSVRAAILTSTRAATGKPTDEFSDYDVILIVEDVHEYLEDSWLGDCGNMLTVYRDPVRKEFGFDRFTRVTQYEDGLKIDFSVCSTGWLSHLAQQPGLPDELDVGYRVLLDKNGLAKGLPPFTLTAYIPQPPSEEAYQTCVMDFFSNSSYVAKHICRGDIVTLMAMQNQMKYERLRHMLEWKLGIESGWTVPDGAYGRNLDKRLDPITRVELLAAYAGPGKAENWEALFRTIDLFERVAQEVAGELNFMYPADIAKRTIAYLERVKIRDVDSI